MGVASIGQTLVILLGGIDLSTPFIIGFANVVAAQLFGDGMNFVLVCVIVAVLALAIGALNGALSSTLNVHPLIVTLGVGTAVQGAVLLWTAGFPRRLSARSGNPLRLHWRSSRSSAGAVAGTGLLRLAGRHDADTRENVIWHGGCTRWEAIRRPRPTR